MSATALVGGAISVVGGVISYAAQQKMVAEQTAISTKTENIRKQQMLLDAQRRKRGAVRQALLQRSLAVANGAAQGASLGSGVAAGKGSAAANAGEAEQSVNSASILGGRMFNLNKAYFKASQSGQAWIGLGQGLSAVGGAVLGNAGEINALMGWNGPRTPAGVPTGNGYPNYSSGGGNGGGGVSGW